MNIGAGDERRLAEAAGAVPDHGDAPAVRLVAVADRAVADETAADRVGQVGQRRLHVHRAGGEQHAARAEAVCRPVLLHLGQEADLAVAVGLLLQA
jgi:hypothetical protein